MEKWNKKILLLGLILIILAGIVVVALKGFNVSLLYQQHESISVVIGQDVNLSEVKEICNEVFGNKKTVVRVVELFNDSVNISAESITDEEKQSLVDKLNEKYGTEFTVDSITVDSNSNIRIRDLVRPYIAPVVVSCIIIIAYMIVRFRKLKLVDVLSKIALIIVLTEAFLASIIAIVRLPLTSVVINLMLGIALFELVLYINCKEKDLVDAKK